jgi:ABC-type uncharacterized transport system ATPase component
MMATERLITGAGVSATVATHDCELASCFGGRQVIISHGRIVRDLRGPERIGSGSELRRMLAECEAGSRTYIPCPSRSLS